MQMQHTLTKLKNQKEKSIGITKLKTLSEKLMDYIQVQEPGSFIKVKDIKY